MRSASALCGIILATFGATAAAQRATVQSDQEALIKLEREWNDAFYRKDVAFIQNLLADEFVATYEDGTRGDKAKELKLIAEFNQQVTSATQEDFTVKVFGDTAVVWFTLRLVGIKQGERAELKLSYTDVWAQKDGRWQCVSSQSTRMSAR
jgi:ketosteroid isomerase-like protein